MKTKRVVMTKTLSVSTGNIKLAVARCRLGERVLCEQFFLDGGCGSRLLICHRATALTQADILVRWRYTHQFSSLSLAYAKLLNIKYFWFRSLTLASS